MPNNNNNNINISIGDGTSSVSVSSNSSSSSSSSNDRRRKKRKISNSENVPSKLDQNFLKTKKNLVQEMFSNESSIFSPIARKNYKHRYMDDKDNQRKLREFLEKRDALHNVELSPPPSPNCTIEQENEKEQSIENNSFNTSLLDKKKKALRKETDQLLDNQSHTMRIADEHNNFMIAPPEQRYDKMSLGAVKNHRHAWGYYQPFGGTCDIPLLVEPYHIRYQSTILSNKVGHKAPALIDQLQDYDELLYLPEFREYLDVSAVHCIAHPFWVKDVSCFKLYLIFTTEGYFIDFFYVKMN